MYENLQNVASDILSKFGQGKIEYVETVPGDGPRDDPGPSREITHPLVGSARGVSQRYVQDGTAVAGDLQVTVNADAVRPTIDGAVKIDGRSHDIRQVIASPAAGVPVVYTLILKV